MGRDRGRRRGQGVGKLGESTTNPRFGGTGATVTAHTTASHGLVEQDRSSRCEGTLIQQGGQGLGVHMAHTTMPHGWRSRRKGLGAVRLHGGAVST